MEILELANNPTNHPYFVAAQFHPEYKSRWDKGRGGGQGGCTFVLQCYFTFGRGGERGACAFVSMCVVCIPIQGDKDTNGTGG